MIYKQRHQLPHNREKMRFRRHVEHLYKNKWKKVVEQKVFLRFFILFFNRTKSISTTIEMSAQKIGCKELIIWFSSIQKKIEWNLMIVTILLTNKLSTFQLSFYNIVKSFHCVSIEFFFPVFHTEHSQQFVNRTRQLFFYGNKFPRVHLHYYIL